MAIQIKCPKCDKQYSLRDEMAGKSVRCKECQTSFVVSEPEVHVTPEPTLKAKRKTNGDTAAPGPKKKSMSPLLIVAGILGCMMVFSCCGGVAGGGYYMATRAKRSADNLSSQMAFDNKDLQASFDKALKDAAKNNPNGGGANSPPKSSGGSTELDGTYTVSEAEMMGQKVPPARMKTFSDYVFQGNTLSYSMGGTKVTGTIKLNPAANPAQLDFTSAGSTTLCIYKIEGDTVTLCMGFPAGPSRPTEFKSSGKDVIAFLVLKKK